MENKKKEYTCPKCGDQLEVQIACGAESYFCDTCKELVSRSKIEGHPNYLDQHDE